MSLERMRRLIGRFREQITAYAPGTPTELPFGAGEARELMESMLLARHLDRAAHELRAAGHGHYTICSTGHEANAVLGRLTRPERSGHRALPQRGAAARARATGSGCRQRARHRAVAGRFERGADERRSAQGVRRPAPGHDPLDQHHRLAPAAGRGARVRTGTPPAPRARACRAEGRRRTLPASATRA